MFFTAIHQMMTEKRGSHDCHPKSERTTDRCHITQVKRLKDEAQNQIVPLTVTGTPQELDAGFLQTVTRPMQKASG